MIAPNDADSAARRAAKDLALLIVIALAGGKRTIELPVEDAERITVALLTRGAKVAGEDWRRVLTESSRRDDGAGPTGSFVGIDPN